MIAEGRTDGATSPGIQERSDAITVSGYLMPGRGWRRTAIGEPCTSPAIMMVKPTPMATPAMPTSVWRTRAVTWVQAMSRMSLAAMVSRTHQRGGANLLTLRRASLTTESICAEIADEITTVSGSAEADAVAAGGGKGLAALRS